jgi:hypothetical protein
MAQMINAHPKKNSTHGTIRPRDPEEVHSRHSDLLPNEKQKPAAGAPFRRPIPYFCIPGSNRRARNSQPPQKLAGTLGLNAAEVK